MSNKKAKLRIDRILILLALILILIIIVFSLTSKKGSNLEDASNVNVSVSDSAITTTADTTTTSTTTEDTTPQHDVQVVDGATYIDGILIVNKSYSIPAEYQGYNGGYDDFKPEVPQGLFPEVVEAYNQLKADSDAEGLNVYMASGYRSYYYQERVYNSYCEVDSPEVVDTYSARPGYSEHQSGYAFDLNTIDDSFADTPEGKWIDENCYKYGFIIRFPKGKEDITGYQYESWHLRYVGVDVATYIHENNLCLEEYLGVDSVYAE